MSIEEFKLPISDPDNLLLNYATAIKLCALSYYEPYTLNGEISDYSNLRMVKYSLVKDVYVYYLELGKQLIVLVNAPSGFRRLKDYITHVLESNIIELVIQVNLDLKRLNYKDVYCVGHSAGGLYSKYLASNIKTKCITVGELSSYLPEPYLQDIDYVRYVSNKDLLTNRKVGEGLILEVEKTPPNDILEGISAHSIDTYLTYLPTLSLV